MSAHPPTMAGEPGADRGFGWHDHATLHHREGGGGVFHAMKRLRSGTFAELVAFLQTLPEAERAAYVIEKAGDRQYLPEEIRIFAGRADFPLQSGHEGQPEHR